MRPPVQLTEQALGYMLSTLNALGYDDEQSAAVCAWIEGSERRIDVRKLRVSQIISMADLVEAIYTTPPGTSPIILGALRDVPSSLLLDRNDNGEYLYLYRPGIF